MASKTSLARRAGSAPPVLENISRPDHGRIFGKFILSSMLKPRKDIGKRDISKKKGGSSSSGAAMPAHTPPASFVIFMLDFMKSEECESVVLKAAEDAWILMSEAEKGPYESKALETCAALERAAESHEMMMNARKATPAAAPPTEEKLSSAATTGGPAER